MVNGSPIRCNFFDSLTVFVYSVATQLMSIGVIKKLLSIPKTKLLVSYVNNVLITPEFSRRLESRRQSPIYIIIRDNFTIKQSNQQLGSRCFVIMKHRNLFHGRKFAEA